MRKNRVLDVGIAVVGVLFVIYVFYSWPDMKVALLPYYYHYIDRQAGALAYEKEYCDVYNKADEMRVRSNQLLDDTLRDVNNLNGKSASEYYEEFNQKQDILLHDREQYIERMIEIDEKALDLEKTGTYRAFYEKRYESDRTEREAFREYKLATAIINKGTLYYKFSELYTSLMDYMVKEGIQKINKDNIYELKTRLIKIENFYKSEIEPELKADTFTPAMKTRFSSGMEDMRLMTKFHEERVAGNDDNASEVLQKALASMDQSGKADAVDDFLHWSQEKVQPHYVQQDLLHKKAATQFAEAYAYAKAHNLDGILKVWNNVPPGFDKKI